MELIEARLSAVSCPAGTVLVSQGSWHGVLYMVRSGVLRVHVETSQGDTREIARLIAGDSIGEMSLLTGSPASATVAAVVDSELWALGHAEFLELVTSCPKLYRNMAVILSRRLSAANRAPDLEPIRWMRVRMHPEVPPRAAEEIARAVARHLAVPLLVLDHRVAVTWRPAERLPSLESLSSEHELLERLRSDQSPGVLAVSTIGASGDLGVHVGERLAGHVTHVLVLICDGKSIETVAGGREKPCVDVILWPAGERKLPSDVADVALVTGYDEANTRRLLESRSREYGARVVRSLDPAGSDGARHLEWLGRHLAGLKIGVAFGGGGARGYAHLGVLEGLHGSSVPVDYAGGCSIGALVASGFASGMSVDQMLRELDAAPRHLAKFTVSRTSILSERGREYLFRERLFGDTCIEDLPIPLAIVAVDILQRREVVMDRGPLWKALLASTAIPGIYPPVWIGDHCLVDGGILDPVPASVTRSLGADVVLGVRLGSRPDHQVLTLSAASGAHGKRSPHLLDVFLRAFDTMASEITARVLEEADVTMVADVPPIGLREFARGRAYVPEGRAALERVWMQMTALLPWLREGEFDGGE